MNEIQEAMQRAISFLQEQTRGLHSASITPALVGTVKVLYCGQLVPIANVAHTSLLAATRQISVEPYDKNMVGTINTALKTAGFTAYVFSKTAICVSIPAPSGDEKERVKKRVKQLGEEAKVAIRNVRKKFKKNDVDIDIDELQSITDQTNQLVDDIVKQTIGRL